MVQSQSPVETSVIAFKPRNAASSTLSARDRLDLAHWHDHLRISGYRVVLYDREPGDSPEVGSFLSIYRRGQPWALWSLARMGARLKVWSSRNSKDVGAFSTLNEALAALIPECAAVAESCDQAGEARLITLSRVS